MAVRFRCPLCRVYHHSRMRASSPEWLVVAMTAFGEIYEKCPLTLRWVRLAVADLEWVGDEPAAGPARGGPV